MLKKISLFMGVIFVSIFILGCATTGSKHMEMEIQKMRTQVQSLEQELKDKDEEIEGLELQIEKERRGRLNTEKQLAAKRSQLASKQTGVLPSISIRKIQEALKHAGFYDGAIDGKLGPRTKEAVRAFQKARGLKPDGIVGRETWGALARYLSETESTK